MNAQDATKIVKEKSNDELLAMLAHPDDWQSQVLDAAKALLQSRGVEFSAAIPRTHQVETTSDKHNSEATANTSLILGIIGALFVFVAVISRGLNFSSAPAGILGGFLGFIAFFLGIFAVFRNGSTSKAVIGIVTGGLVFFSFLLPLFPSGHNSQTLSRQSYSPQTANTQFWMAIMGGDLEKVQELLKQNPSLVFQKDSDGATSLSFAVDNDYKDMMVLLLAYKADPNAKDNNGKTPLHIATIAGNDDVAELLLANKAEINAKDNTGEMPLHYAAVYGHQNMIGLLLTNMADVNAKDNYGDTPMDIAVLSNYREAAELLRQHGGQDFLAEFIEATTQNDLEKVKELLKENPNLVFNRDRGGETALHCAISKDMATLLLANKSDVNAKDENGKTPLHLAAMAGKLDMVELLLSHGADVNAKDNSGEMPVQAAVSNGHRDVAEFLCQHGGYDYDFELVDSAERDDLDIVKELLKDQPHLNTSMALHVASAKGHKDVVELLLANNADVHSTDNLGRTPLHAAAAGGYQDVVELLLIKKADVNVKDDNGQTPLFNAPNKDIVGLLLAKGADVNAADNLGQTPLHAAAARGYKDVVELLLANKADVNARDHNGETPLHMAEFMGNFFGRDQGVADLLRQHGGRE